ncbi:condensation domain-containing protein [Kitasatospora sp. NPDC018058]|uniref:condensation domain-containing protein n=1 Tax=Kitasatospora sp. NPDC018058 TaxID=3364025 RepID=UPI0037BE9E30
MSTTAAPTRANGTEQRIPLSYNQEFLRAFDKGEIDGAFGHRHTLVCGWRVTGEVDTAALQGALDDLVARHEVLRTAVAADADGGFQEIHPACPVDLEVRDLSGADGPREVAAEEFLNELDSTPYSVRTMPHLRAVLGRFDATDSVLVLVTHHTATDAWSLQVLMRDLADAYAARAADVRGDLPEARQYREFARWQQETAGSARVEAQRAYWRERLAGAQITAIASDRPRPEDDRPSAYGVHRFVFDPQLSRSVTEFAKASRSTPFMVLAAAYSLLLRERTGTTDVVFPTFSSGRYDERFTDSVGPYFNFVPIRIDTTGCRTVREVLDQARDACMGAYQHEVPFARIAEDSPALLAPFADGFLAVVAFEVLQSPFPLEGNPVGGLEFAEIRRRVLSQEVSSAIPDGGLWAMDVLPGGELAGSLKFDHNRFDESTAVALVARFRELLGTLTEAPETPLTHG